MSRVITFSTKFPAKHSKAGCQTDFVLKMLRSLRECGLLPMHPSQSIMELPGIMDAVQQAHSLKVAMCWASWLPTMGYHKRTFWIGSRLLSKKEDSMARYFVGNLKSSIDYAE